RPQERRPPADRLCRRNRQPCRRSSPKAGIEELRHGGRKPGLAGRHGLRVRRERSRAGDANRRDPSGEARRQDRDCTAHLRRSPEAAARLTQLRIMNRDELRQALSFYQDLGITELYRATASDSGDAPVVPAPIAATPPVPAPDVLIPLAPPGDTLEKIQ